MKILTFFTPLIFILLLVSCKQTITEPVEQLASDIYVSFDIGPFFYNDSVKVALDDKVLLESRITTNAVIGLSWSSGLLKLSRDKHILHIAVIELNAQKDYEVDSSNDTSTVYMWFDRNANQIDIRQVEGKIKYR